MRGRICERAAGTGLILVVSFLLLGVCAGPAFAGAWWHLSTRVAPSQPMPGQKAIVIVSATNVGDSGVNATVSPVTIKDILPEGLEATKNISGKPAFREFPTNSMTCDPQTLSCTSQPETFPAFERLEVKIEVNVKPDARTDEQNVAEVRGGEQEGQAGAEVPPVKLARQIPMSGQATAFGVEEDGYTLVPEEEGGAPDTKAGSHPFQLSTTLNLNQAAEPLGELGLAATAPALPKNLSFDLPPGVIGDPRAVAPCPIAGFLAVVLPARVNDCPADSAIGVVVVTINEPIVFKDTTRAVPLWNLEPAQGEPARFGFEVIGDSVVLDTALRTGGDYGVSVSVHEAPQTAQVLSSEVTIWGTPGASSHDQSRGWECVAGRAWEKEATCQPPEHHSANAFLTLPGSCTGPLKSTVQGESWPVKTLGNEPGQTFPLTGSTEDQLPGFENCNALPFEPSIALQSTEHSASTPTGLNVNVSVPQQGALQAGQLAEPPIKTTTVTLPAGVQLNPAAAGGLQACSEQQIGYQGLLGEDPLSPGAPQPPRFTTAPATCPNASKVGRVRIQTPLLEQELQGSVYLATPAPLGEPDQNPFNTLLALYIVAEDPAAGIRVKLAGQTELEPQTGRVTSTFQDTPQVPFEELSVELSGGPRASLSTPSSCGSSPIEASFLAWSAESENALFHTPSTRPEEQLTVTSGAEGGPCSDPPPFAPALQGGATSSQAGAFTGFALAITRPGSDQQLAGATVTLPPGDAAVLASVTPCPEPQASQATCGSQSEIGQATASAGLGPDPYTVTGGRVYITGPYQGAPFGLSIVTPAVAGPFDLGNVVVRSKIEVNPHTAQVTISSAIPTFVQGIGRPPSGVPLQLRQIQVTVNRPDFEFNPTNCNPHRIEATLTGAQGTNANMTWPFQVTGCQSLPFTPGVTASTRGKTSKADGASLDLKFTSGNGQAHIAKTILTIPATLPARLTTIQKACVARVFEANPAACPEGSDIGTAVVHTPVLKSPVAGPIYLVSHGNAAWPDAELVLQGEGITVILDGQTAIKKGVTTSSFLSVPDAPFESVEATLPEGPHSALTMNPTLAEKTHYNLCGQHLTIPTQLTGQNGTLVNETVKVAVQGCAAVKPSKTKKLSRTQQLARALETCRRIHARSRAERASCERDARRRYGARQAARKLPHGSARNQHSTRAAVS
jgi:hypothetical protein